MLQEKSNIQDNNVKLKLDIVNNKLINNDFTKNFMKELTNAITKKIKNSLKADEAYGIIDNTLGAGKEIYVIPNKIDYKYYHDNIKINPKTYHTSNGN